MKRLVIALVSVLSLPAVASITIPMNFVDVDGVGKSAGSVIAAASDFGVVFTPNLKGLPAGLHGFHVHQNPSCMPKEKQGKIVAAFAAGGHFDPHNTKQHGVPWGKGHLGDLPALYVDQNGNARQPVLAPRLKLSDLKGRALMIHAGGDNHSDHPQPLGGGGSRIVCGVTSK
ncbi:superoxide dismutase family protein [Agarilytica rhodophyticola]|uniref:superoxide dismutase family protein n=1 Tax=Agarilytica rhodophyticola TaxID=1737490 RepID=UPI000B34569D|nr:superoxide dismutase family protein [Agarilytica rhodophyticola]